MGRRTKGCASSATSGACGPIPVARGSYAAAAAPAAAAAAYTSANINVNDVNTSGGGGGGGGGGAAAAITKCVGVAAHTRLITYNA
jgi:hypothetical protein